MKTEFETKVSEIVKGMLENGLYDKIQEEDYYSEQEDIIEPGCKQIILSYERDYEKDVIVDGVTYSVCFTAYKDVYEQYYRNGWSYERDEDNDTVDYSFKVHSIDKMNVA